jgi:hypothetical protein
MDILLLLRDFFELLPQEREATIDMWTRLEPERTTAERGTPAYSRLVRTLALALADLGSCRDVRVVIGCSFPRWFTNLLDPHDEDGVPVPCDGSFQLGPSSEGNYSFSTPGAPTQGSRSTAPHEQDHSSDATYTLPALSDSTIDDLLVFLQEQMPLSSPPNPSAIATTGTAHPASAASSAPMSFRSVELEEPSEASTQASRQSGALRRLPRHGGGGLRPRPYPRRP